MIVESLLQHKTLDSDPVGNPPVGSIYVYAKADGIYEKSSSGIVTKISNVDGGGIQNVFIQQMEPTETIPFIWFKTNAVGKVIDIRQKV